jgi:hypothetical protein
LQDFIAATAKARLRRDDTLRPGAWVSSPLS